MSSRARTSGGTAAVGAPRSAAPAPPLTALPSGSAFVRLGQPVHRLPPHLRNALPDAAPRGPPAHSGTLRPPLSERGSAGRTNRLVDAIFTAPAASATSRPTRQEQEATVATGRAEPGFYRASLPRGHNRARLRVGRGANKSELLGATCFAFFFSIFLLRCLDLLCCGASQLDDLGVSRGDSRAGRVQTRRQPGPGGGCKARTPEGAPSTAPLPPRRGFERSPYSCLGAIPLKELGVKREIHLSPPEQVSMSALPSAAELFLLPFGCKRGPPLLRRRFPSWREVEQALGRALGPRLGGRERSAQA